MKNKRKYGSLTEIYLIMLEVFTWHDKKEENWVSSSADLTLFSNVFLIPYENSAIFLNFKIAIHAINNSNVTIIITKR